MTAATPTHTHRAPGPPRRGSRSPASSPLAGTATMVRFALRRDRVRLPVWVLAHGLLVLYIGAALPQIAPQEQDLGELTVLLSQPVGRMFTGPAFGMQDPSYETFFAAGYMPYLFILAALMNIFLIIRHTRTEEQSGRAELIRAAVTGRHTALTAALVVACVANTAAAALVVVLTLAVGYATTGSVLVGIAAGLTGMAFAGVAAVTAQLSEFSRPAAGVAGAVLAAAFVLRALGDMAEIGGSALSWASPLGWAAQTAPYVHDRWAPLLLLAGLAAMTAALAYVLQDRRDFGAGLVRPRPGAARAHPALGHPWGLAARLQRGGLLGWGTGIVLLGVVDGAFTQAMIDAGEGMPEQLRAVFGSDALVEGYTAFLGSFMVLFVCGYAVFGMQTLRSEEDSGRTDAVLATPVSRLSYVGAHVASIAMGALLIVVLTGLGTGAAAAVVTGDGSLVGEVLAAHLAVLPGALAVLGLCTLLYGGWPRAMALLGWTAVAVMGVFELFGDLLDLPETLLALHPLHHLASVPVEDFAAVPYVLVAGAAALLALLGLMALRRRQLHVV